MMYFRLSLEIVYWRTTMSYEKYIDVSAAMTSCFLAYRNVIVLYISPGICGSVRYSGQHIILYICKRINEP